MNITTKATNIEFTDEIKDYLEKRLEHVHKFLHEDGDRQITIQVDLGKETNHHTHGEVFFANFRCDYSGEYYYAEAHNETVEAAIDEAKEELVREITSKHEKERERERNEAAKAKDKLREVDDDETF